MKSNHALTESEGGLTGSRPPPGHPPGHPRFLDDSQHGGGNIRHLGGLIFMIILVFEGFEGSEGSLCQSSQDETVPSLILINVGWIH